MNIVTGCLEKEKQPLSRLRVRSQWVFWGSFFFLNISWLPESGGGGCCGRGEGRPFLERRTGPSRGHNGPVCPSQRNFLCLKARVLEPADPLRTSWFSCFMEASRLVPSRGSVRTSTSQNGKMDEDTVDPKITPLNLLNLFPSDLLGGTRAWC